jgi:hypothetical protein
MASYNIESSAGYDTKKKKDQLWSFMIANGSVQINGILLYFCVCMCVLRCAQTCECMWTHISVQTCALCVNVHECVCVCVGGGGRGV